MTRFGLDSTSPVSPANHHAVGSTVAIRYLSRSTSKVVTRAEYNDNKAHGIDTCLVFEDSGRPDLHGYEDGKADAQWALAQSIDILGKPLQPPRIPFAWDSDPAGHPEKGDAYYDGVAAVMGTFYCGPYGAFDVAQHLYARGFRTLYQTYAWSAGRVCEHNLLMQYSNDHTVGGVGVDYDHCEGFDFGQWDRPAAPPTMDPHHYHRFSTHNYGRQRTEVATVRDYDGARKKLLKYPGYLHELETELAWFAGRVYNEAWYDEHNVRRAIPTWGVFYRGWRYQQLIHRSQGKKLA